MSLYNFLLAGYSCLGAAAGAAAEGGEQQQTQWWVILVYIAIFGAFLYFIMIRPQRKQKKEKEEKMKYMEPGSSVLTTSGFYGTIVAVNGDTVIVEFGNNKNCRIPMSKQAISQIEKPGAENEAPQPEKKFFGKKKANEAEAAQAATETTEPIEEATAPAPEETTTPEE